MSQQMLVVLIVVFICLGLYIVWSVKHQSEIGASGSYKNFGFSYIGIAQAVNLLISIVVGIIPTTFASSRIQMNQMIPLSIVLGFVTFYLLNFSIVKFRNIAIIAKTNTEILKKLEQLQITQEENNGKEN